VKELYNAVIAHGRRSTRGQDVDNTPRVVSYNKFFVSLKELANSMIPLGELKTTIVEFGIESIINVKGAQEEINLSSHCI
jgi:hypothetical protein